MTSIETPSVKFVRSAMLSPEPPPMTETGVIKWVRENLFSGWFNSILTLLGIGALYWLIKAGAPWLLHSVWNANSLAECRAAIASSFGDTATGACWAVIRERWNQFMFGFYPQDQYWRPILAFVLLFVALAPVLFLSLPRKMLWFSALYPALAFLLLWGGSVWVPVVALWPLSQAILLIVWPRRISGSWLEQRSAWSLPVCGGPSPSHDCRARFKALCPSGFSR